jgi:hypothetical protein
MNHNEIDTGILRAYLDGELNSAQITPLTEHVSACAECQAELKVLSRHAASVRSGLDFLPQHASAGVAPAWSAMRLRLEERAANTPARWSPWRTWSLAAGGAVAVTAVLAFTVAPVRGWAENLLSIFRVEHVTVLEINPDTMKVKGLEGDQAFSEQMSRVISDEVTVTQPPQKPFPVADVATASKLAGFDVHLIADEAPALVLFRSTISAQMKIDRDRLQSILNEAGRSDVQIPQSVDGAVIGMRVPAGIMALYGNCGDTAARMQGIDHADTPGQPEDATCVKLIELPSPTASAPQQVDPAEIARVVLQFAGLSANEAASFTQTVDWTTTFVLPILHGQSSYEKVIVGGNEGVLLRPKSAQPSTGFDLLWVDNGIVYSLMGTGDDTRALNLASQIE